MSRTGWVAGLALLACAAGASAQLNVMPDEAQGLEIDPKLGARLPLDLTFKDADGKPIRLADLMGQGRTTILTLNYFNCPLLCSQQLNRVVDALKAVPYHLGGDYDLVTVSFNAEEGPQLAKLKQANYWEVLGLGGAPRWPFLTGDAAAIQALTQAVGFPFRKDPTSNEYNHPDAFLLITPDGRVARYLPGLTIQPSELRLSLVEASEGKISASLGDSFFLLCYTFDGKTGRYVAMARNIMAVGAGATVLALGLALGGLWLVEWRRHRQGARDAAGSAAVA